MASSMKSINVKENRNLFGKRTASFREEMASAIGEMTHKPGQIKNVSRTKSMNHSKRQVAVCAEE